MSHFPYYTGKASSKIHFRNPIRNRSTRKRTTHHNPTRVQQSTVEPINQDPLVATSKTSHTTQIVHGRVRVHTSKLENQLTSGDNTRGIEAVDLFPKKRSHGLTQQRRDLLVTSTQQQYSAQRKQPASQKNA